MKRLIYASTNYDDIEHVAHNIFNDLMRDQTREELTNHTELGAQAIRDEIAANYADYRFDDIDIEDIVNAVFDNVDSYNSTWSDYYGKFAYDKYGDIISQKFPDKTVSKRRDELDVDEDDYIGLRVMARKLHTYTGMILEALEGMCYNNKAYEFDDSHYFVGSYEDWKKFGAV